MERQILGYKCEKCETVHYPNRARCKKCGNDTFTTIPMPLEGKLVTYTRLHNLPPDFEVPDMQFGIVDLGDGLRSTGQLAIEHPKSGMKVKGQVTQVRQQDLKRYFGVVFSPA